MAKKRRLIRDKELFENYPVLYYADSIGKLLSKKADRELKQIFISIYPDARIRI